MRIIECENELANLMQTGSEPIGFVPTMGALHNGHVSLIKRCREENGCVVVSIFVNPTQFLTHEDLTTYPRNLEADIKICERCRVDYLFVPKKEAIYGNDELSVQAPVVRGYVLEGERRPGHFNGVLTVLLKLFNIVHPARAYFGKKDAQQLLMIQHMVERLFMRIEIIGCDTVRDHDGLALSSRNAYLSDSERSEALKIVKSLKSVANSVMDGTRDAQELKKGMEKLLYPLEADYIAFTDRKLHPIEQIEVGNSLVLIAVKVGTTRLLDNMWL